MSAHQNAAVTLTGGCLCEAIQYEVSFHEDSQWPPVVCPCLQPHAILMSLLRNDR